MRQDINGRSLATARVRSTQFTVKAPAIALTGLYSPQVQLQLGRCLCRIPPHPPGARAAEVESPQLAIAVLSVEGEVSFGARHQRAGNTGRIQASKTHAHQRGPNPEVFGTRADPVQVPVRWLGTGREDGAKCIDDIGTRTRWRIVVEPDAR